MQKQRKIYIRKRLKSQEDSNGYESGYIREPKDIILSAGKKGGTRTQSKKRHRWINLSEIREETSLKLATITD